MLRKKVPDVFDDNQQTDRWLISYADFITLLFAFFVVMYSVSQVNENKYKILSDSLQKAFEKTPANQPLIQVGEVSRRLMPSSGDYIDASGGEGAADSEAVDLSQQENFASSDEFKQLEQGLRESLGDLIDQDLAEIKSDADWINISLRSGLLFPSGSDQLNDGVRPLLEEVSKHLNKNRQLIRIHGHTDNVPIQTERFPSNWELSSARAVAIVRGLQALGVDPARMTVEGHGEFQPIADNSTAEGRAKNRRVVISISRKRQLPQASKQLTDQNRVTEAAPVQKEAEPKFQIVQLPGGGILIRGKEDNATGNQAATRKSQPPATNNQNDNEQR